MSISEEKSKAIFEMRRRQILDAAITLFDEQGFSTTKISDISDKAGISKGLVYRYFNSKEEILLALHENITHCINECFEIPNAKDAITTFAMRLLSYPYYKDYGAPPIRVFFNAIVRNEIEVPDEYNPLKGALEKSILAPFLNAGRSREFLKREIARFSEIFSGNICWDTFRN